MFVDASYHLKEDKMINKGNSFPRDTVKDWLLNSHTLFRSKKMEQFDKHIENSHDEEVSQAENDFGSVTTTLDPLLILFKRDRAESSFSYGMSELLRSPQQSRTSNINHFDFEASNLMGLFEIGKLYLNDGLYAVTDEIFMENDDENDHLIPLCFRIEDLKMYVPIEKIMKILSNSTMTILKGDIKLVLIKTQPLRKIYGISCLVSVNSMLIVQCLIGVVDDPTFEHKIRQDFTFKCSAIKLSHRVNIGTI